MSRSSSSQKDFAKKTLLGLGALLLLAGIVVVDVHEVISFQSAGKSLQIKLNRGPQTVLEFPSKMPETKAVIIFGSGDGGWSSFEEAICQGFQNEGYEVIGIDFQGYAQTDYTLDILQSDFDRLAQTAQVPFGNHPPPLIIGGYSMGAAQAIAVAGGPHPPANLAGLLLVDPCSRGRYGLRSSDKIDVLPDGPGTFGVDEFAHTLGPLRVVQWHASDDDIDSTSWLDSLTAPHQTHVFPNNGHDYNTDRADFIQQLVASAGWLLNPMDHSMAAGTDPSP